MSDDYVSRDYLLGEYDRQHQGPPGGARKIIAEAPAADVVEVRHGRWMKDCDRVMGDGWTYTQRHCSECGGQTVECVNYCQFCGAKMDGGQDDV